MEKNMDKPVRNKVFFHIREANMPTHTYCIKKGKDNDLYVGYSIVHEPDNFCRKTGCRQAEKKADIAMRIKNDNFTTSNIVTLLDNTGKKEQVFILDYPNSIKETLPPVIAKTAKILKMSGDIYVKTIVSPLKRRIPFAKIFNV
jgi:hypothetical protein